MNPSVTPAPETPKKRRVLSARRVILLATTIAGLGAAAFVVGPDLNLSANYPAALAQNLTEQARKAPAPVGFADIVEKVKPAVISVRVKVDDAGSATTGLGDNKQHSAGLARILPPLRHARHAERWPAWSRAAWPRSRDHGPGLRLLHFGGRLCGDQQPRRRQSRERRGHDRRRQDPHRQGHRHRSAHRSRADQGRRRPVPLCEAVRQDPAHRRLGARGRQSVRPRRHRHGRHRFGARPRHRRQRL